jgi:cell division protein FtsL
MNDVSHFVQKYRQAPWRVQLQWLVLFVLGLVLVALVAFGYLNISTRTTQAGREIQNLREIILSEQQKNAGLETQLAALTSSQVMEQRARALGFQPVDPAQITYVVVPGYTPPKGIDMSSVETQPATPMILPEYTQSLLDWFAEKMQSTASVSGGQP